MSFPTGDPGLSFQILQYFATHKVQIDDSIKFIWIMTNYV